jgi:hypothetical protein
MKHHQLATVVGLDAWGADRGSSTFGASVAHAKLNAIITSAAVALHIQRT